MSSRNDRYLITQSLLSAWLWQYKAFDPEAAQRDFMKTLRREPTKPNAAMLSGIQFENMVTAFLQGCPPEDGHKWETGIRLVAEEIQGAQLQVPAYRDTLVDGVPFLLYGRMDALLAGTIFDIKFSTTYEVGKYLDSPQHPMYFACCPEARRFTYLISNGRELCRETYTPTETAPVETTIRQFMGYLEDMRLVDLYTQKWKARN